MRYSLSLAGILSGLFLSTAPVVAAPLFELGDNVASAARMKVQFTNVPSLLSSFNISGVALFSKEDCERNSFIDTLGIYGGSYPLKDGATLSMNSEGLYDFISNNEIDPKTVRCIKLIFENLDLNPPLVNDPGSACPMFKVTCDQGYCINTTTVSAVTFGPGPNCFF